MDLKMKWLDLRELPSNLIQQLIITAIVSIIVSIVTYFSSRDHFTTLEITLLIILAVIVISIVSYIIYRRMNKKIPTYTAINADVHILEKEITHRWLSKDKLIHRRRFKLRSMKNGLREYHDKFQWTGDNFIISAGNGDFQVKLTGKKNVFDGYKFIFDKSLHKGEVIELEAIWNLDNTSLKASPFFSTTIDEPTDLLIMNLELSADFGICKANTEISSHKGASVALQENIVRLDGDGWFSWRKKNPRLLYHYEINWVMPV